MTQTMISVEEADQIIAANMSSYPATLRSLEEAHGCILREDVLADRDYPPYNRVTMDGAAVAFELWKKGRRDFNIEATLQAGQPSLILKNPSNSCIQIMTGAVLPENANCVIPYEELVIEKNVARVRDEAMVVADQHIHKQGTDCKKGEVLLKKGRRLYSSQIALIASSGKENVLVSEAPSVAIVSTGDEIAELGQSLQPYQIRPSNAYGIRSALTQRGFERVTIHKVADDRQKTHDLFSTLLRDHDVLIVTGGVSMGKADLVPGVLADLSVRCLFHKIKQTPGKPFWFGLAGEKPVFALPGNPGASLVCLHRYVLPHLECAMGLSEAPLEFAALTQEVIVKNAFAFFMPVTVKMLANGQQDATPIRYGGSGDLVSLGRSDGFLELPAEVNPFPAGGVYRFYRWSA